MRSTSNAGITSLKTCDILSDHIFCSCCALVLRKILIRCGATSVLVLIGVCNLKRAPSVSNENPQMPSLYHLKQPCLSSIRIGIAQALAARIHTTLFSPGLVWLVN